MSTVLVLADVTPTGVRNATLELLTAARALGEPAAVVCGPVADDVTAALGAHGAATVYSITADAIDDFLAVPKVDALAAVAAQTSPTDVLITSGPDGKALAAPLPVRPDSGPGSVATLAPLAAA